jgi:hypothetical protein
MDTHSIHCVRCFERAVSLERRQGYPWKFNRLTDEGRRFLDGHNHLQAEETLQRMYETITDKSEKMVKYENAPRPEVA